MYYDNLHLNITFFSFDKQICVAQRDLKLNPTTCFIKDYLCVANLDEKKSFKSDQLLDALSKMFGNRIESDEEISELLEDSWNLPVVYEDKTKNELIYLVLNKFIT